MLTKNQQAWVNALRSGEFKQGREMLQSGDAYCCLGVLCVVAEREGVHVDKGPCGLVGYNLSNQRFVRDWVGITSSYGHIECLETGLTTLNDGDPTEHRGKSFAEIADIIEQNAESLFERTENV